VEVDPEFAIGIVFDAGIGLVVESVESTTDDVIELSSVNTVNF
jgi:hypothetical protein